MTKKHRGMHPEVLFCTLAKELAMLGTSVPCSHFRERHTLHNGFAIRPKLKDEDESAF